jgi:DNA-binding transcriptional MerR regulator
MTAAVPSNSPGARAAATGPSRGRASGTLYSIGEVLNLLRPEFADVTISKLRFLESEGLVDPLRTPAGYRKYTPSHVERLRLVLTAQRDRYLPLRVIREQLAALERGERVVGSPFTAPAGPTGTVTVAPDQATSPESGTVGDPAVVGTGRVAGMTASVVPVELGEARLTRAQLKERAGLDDAGLTDLEQYGLLRPGPNGYFGPEALTVARIAARLAKYGLEGRHLRPYRATADREVGLLAQLVAPLTKQAGRNGRAQALETVHELATLCAQLHGALVRQGLRDTLDG